MEKFFGRAFLLGIIFIFSSSAMAALKKDCKVILKAQDNEAIKSDSPQQMSVLELYQNYEALYEVLRVATDDQLSILSAARFRGADQSATTTQYRLSIEVLRTAIRTGNIDAAVTEMQETWLKAERGYVRRILDREMLARLEEASANDPESLRIPIQKIKYRLKQGLSSSWNWLGFSNGSDFGYWFRLYKVQVEYLEDVKANGIDYEPRISLANDAPLPPLQAESLQRAGLPDDVAVSVTSKSRTDFHRDRVDEIYKRLGLAGILKLPESQTPNRVQSTFVTRPLLKDMEEEFTSDPDLHRIHAGQVKWRERLTSVRALLTHASFAPTRMRLTRLAPTSLHPLISALLLLSRDSYKRVIHVPQILSVLDSYPTNLSGLKTQEREAALIQKLDLLLNYSEVNNDGHDLLNTMARANRDLWSEIRIIVIKLHSAEAAVRKKHLRVDSVELSETSWGPVLQLIDEASKEAAKQGGFSLTTPPSTLSHIARIMARIAALGSATAYGPDVIQAVGGALALLF